MTVRDNELGFRAIAIHYSADVDKDVYAEDPEIRAKAEAWLTEARRAYPDPATWAQEMELNWWVSSGTRVYPQFTLEVHTTDAKYRPRKQILRAWDFGYLTSACLVAQIDEQDRLVILREIVRREQTTREFARDVISVCAQAYPHHTAGYRDECDPAGQQSSSTASEASEVRDVDVLRSFGILPHWEYGWSRKDGRALVHQLLNVRLDGTPSLRVDMVECPVLVQGFLGKYVYPAKKGGQAHDEPDESNHPWADVMACLRYLVTSCYTALGLRRPGQVLPVSTVPLAYAGYGTPKRRR